jgi:hypothetical protein
MKQPPLPFSRRKIPVADDDSARRVIFSSLAGQLIRTTQDANRVTVWIGRFLRGSFNPTRCTCDKRDRKDAFVDFVNNWHLGLSIPGILKVDAGSLGLVAECGLWRP